MGKIYEVCEVCDEHYEESKFDGVCSKECFDKNAVLIGGAVAECQYCRKLYLAAKKHSCAL